MTINVPTPQGDFFEDLGDILAEYHGNHHVDPSDSSGYVDTYALNFAGYLQAARCNAGLSIQELAQQAALPEAEVFALERGLILSTEIASSTLYALAKALDEDIDDFALLLEREIPKLDLEGVPARLRNGWNAARAYLGSTSKVLIVICLMVMTLSASAVLVRNNDQLLLPTFIPFNNNDLLAQSLDRAGYVILPLIQVLFDRRYSLSMVILLFFLIIWVAIWRGELPFKLVPKLYRWERPLVYATPLVLLCMVMITGGTMRADSYSRIGSISATEIRTLYPNEFGVTGLGDLAFATDLDHFFVLEQGNSAPSGTGAAIVIFTPYEERVSTLQLGFDVDDTMNMAFDDQSKRLFFLNHQATELVQIAIGPNGVLDLGTLTRVDTTSLGLQHAQGMSIDAAGTRLFILDSGASQIVSVALNAASGFDEATIARIDLAGMGVADLRGIAVNPMDHNLYLLSAAHQMLYELTQSGQSVATYNLAALNLTNPRGLAFAPSADLTDRSDTIHLMIADDGLPALSNDGRVLEVALGPVGPENDEAAAVVASQVGASLNALTPAYLVQTINLFEFSPSSPDPSGIVYMPTHERLLVSDSEVNEMPALFTGDNLFEISLPDTLVRTGTTLFDPDNDDYSDEPTGLGFNPANGHLFVADDTSGGSSARGIFEIAPGPDGLFGTIDDVKLEYIKTSKFEPKSKDPEGVTFDTTSGDLFIVDGVNSEIYRLDAGPNGVFEGVKASSDDVVTHFDTASLGILDPEGIHYNAARGNLILTGKDKTALYEVTTSGSLVQTFDISAANALKPAGVTIAPGSVDTDDTNFYVVDRGIDNNADLSENDGRMYEISRVASSFTVNQSPIVDTSPDQTTTLSNELDPGGETLQVEVIQEPNPGTAIERPQRGADVFKLDFERSRETPWPDILFAISRSILMMLLFIIIGMVVVREGKIRLALTKSRESRKVWVTNPF